MVLVTGAMVGAIAVILLVNFEPFKDAVRHYGEVSAVFTLLLGMLLIASIGKDLATQGQNYKVMPFIFLGSLSLVAPLVYISVIILYWLFRHRRFGLQLIQRVCARRRASITRRLQLCDFNDYFFLRTHFMCHACTLVYKHSVVCGSKEVKDCYENDLTPSE